MTCHYSHKKKIKIKSITLKKKTVLAFAFSKLMKSNLKLIIFVSINMNALLFKISKQAFKTTEMVHIFHLTVSSDQIYYFSQAYIKSQIDQRIYTFFII